MKTTRTTIALLTVIALVMTWVAPVSAARPTKPEPETVNVTMTLVGGQGLATDCVEVGGSILMTRDRKGLVGADEAPLRLVMNNVTWNRQYPVLSGIGFDGCHGDTVAVSPVGNTMYGGLGINIDRNGVVTDVLWHFDYYLDGDTTSRTLPNGKVIVGAYEWTVREYFTLTGNDLNWDPETNTVSGDFYLMHSLYDAETEIGYESFPGSRQPMAFQIIIEDLD